MQVSGVLGTYYAYRFATLIKKQFTDWEAFKMGLIDEDGEIVKKPKTKEEMIALDSVTNLVRKIKKVFVKYIGDNKVINFIIAAYLLKKEDVAEDQYDNIKKEIKNILDEEEHDFFLSVVEKMQTMGY